MAFWLQQVVLKFNIVSGYVCEDFADINIWTIILVKDNILSPPYG